MTSNFLKSIDFQALYQHGLSQTPNVLAAALILVFVGLLFKFTQKPLRIVLMRTHMDQHLIRILVDNIYRVSLIVLGVIMAAAQLGIDVGAALAGIGIIGVAVGFAAQDTFSNIIAGFLIFWDKPFRVGDWISVQNQYGRVAEVTMRSTRIRTPKNTYVVIPNKVIANEVLDNHSKHGETRVDIPIGIAYKESIPQARDVLLKAVENIEGIMNDPAPTVVVKEIADSSINLHIQVWIGDASVELPVFFAASEACKLALDAAGIEIPFPHLQLFVDDVKEGVWKGAKQAIVK